MLPPSIITTVDPGTVYAQCECGWQSKRYSQDLRNHRESAETDGRLHYQLVHVATSIVIPDDSSYDFKFQSAEDNFFSKKMERMSDEHDDRPRVNYLLTNEGFFIDGKRLPAIDIKLHIQPDSWPMLEVTFHPHPDDVTMDINLPEEKP